jgi:hypothetical protein
MYPAMQFITVRLADIALPAAATMSRRAAVYRWRRIQR